jgi:hypothetical protein
MVSGDTQSPDSQDGPRKTRKWSHDQLRTCAIAVLAVATVTVGSLGTVPTASAMPIDCPKRELLAQSYWAAGVLCWSVRANATGEVLVGQGRRNPGGMSDQRDLPVTAGVNGPHASLQQDEAFWVPGDHATSICARRLGSAWPRRQSLVAPHRVMRPIDDTSGTSGRCADAQTWFWHACKRRSALKAKLLPAEFVAVCRVTVEVVRLLCERCVFTF